MQNVGDLVKKYWHLSILVITALISLKLRILNPWDSVFNWTVRLGGNDPWYYYRLIENTIHNFPSRIWFDPFTHYPYGSYTHFGPFLVYLGSIAGIIFNATSGESLRAVLAFIPAIGGILAILPVYLLTREVFDRRTAVLAAFLIAIVPGQFLQRSILGFNDHHIWEAFWQVSTLGTFMLAYNRWKDKNIKDNLNTKHLLYPVIAGICAGLYILAWGPGFIIAPILLSFLFFAFVLGELINADRKNLSLVAVITFVVATLVYIPFAFNYPGFSRVHYSPFQFLVLAGSAVIAAAFYQIERLNEAKFFERLGLGRKGMPVAVVVITAVIVGVFFLLMPDFARNILSIIGVVQPKGGALTIAEVYPFFFTHNGEFTLANAVLHFGSLFFFGMVGIFFSAYRVIRKRNFVELSVLIWAVLMFIALWGQNRFAYYFAAVASVYSALVISVVFDKLHLYKVLENALGAKSKFSYLRVALAVLIALVAIYPTYILADAQSSYAGGPNKQWYDAMLWMKENTPDREKYDDYYLQLYPTPQSNKEPFNYPFETYGVISWWDYGHWIESIAHRMPIANPFQHGIGNKYNNVPGASSFFTAENESYAEWVADELNVKYVVSDIEMETGKFYAMAVWAEGDLPLAEKYYAGFLYYSPSGKFGYASSQWDVPMNSVIIPLRIPSELYYNTMEAKLHLFDGSGLSHYRMIYESDYPGEWKSYASQIDLNNESQVLQTALYESVMRARYGVSPTMGTQEVLYKYAYSQLHERKIGIPVKIAPSGYVKIFERVKGAVVTGKVSGNVTEVTVNATIKTNQNRTFEYWQTVKVEGDTYSVVLPYSHDSRYPVKPITPYYIKAGSVVKELTVKEEQVQSGDVINLDL
ncbi:MAG: oligosaccharyl transferase, archaeosortase A system-associated [Archaeoglobus sp.]|uniref:oligosaccharyl transferase, archaeosortase A system-associated n=1 Tax=Archaeoglobus sp. TaxID=1872626 RepID=UPI001D54D83F|nr:oligosaccharyl transferase, archaeosortase A system-associated [Archaeoglobus sp.]MBO8178990.1 oligosaccharyl transferase, archaeosortase A system-associated [Archaeoglobus sp.]